MTVAIRIRNLNYAYPDGTAALNGVDLTVEAGATIGVVGPPRPRRIARPVYERPQ